MIKWIIIILIIGYWFFYDPQKYYTMLIFGKKGSGKTCDMARRALKAQKKGIKVYSNIDIPGCYKYDPSDIKGFTFESNSLVMCDEVGLIWDNRNFKNFDKGYNEFFKYCRQYKLIFIMYSQSFDVDLKIRLLVDKMALMIRIGKITLIRPITKKIGIATDSNGNGNLVDTYAFGSIFNWQFFYRPRYYGLFHSFNPPPREIIQSTYEDYNEIQEIYKNTTKYLLFKIKILFKKPSTNLKRFRKNINKKVKDAIYE